MEKAMVSAHDPGGLIFPFNFNVIHEPLTDRWMSLKRSFIDAADILLEFGDFPAK